MSNPKFCCEICGTPLGYVDKAKLAVPMTAEMFLPLMPGRGLPPPFQYGRSWELLYCRQCKSRAFHSKDKIMLLEDNGAKALVSVGELMDDGEKHTCKCGKEYSHKSSLLRHQATCKEGK